MCYESSLFAVFWIRTQSRSGFNWALDSDPDSEIPQGTRGSRKEGKNREIYSRAGCSPLEEQRFFKCVLFEGLIRKVNLFVLFFSNVHYF
jgi:hypothetical protein